MTGSVTGIRRRRTVAGRSTRREPPHLPPDRDFYGQTLIRFRQFRTQIPRFDSSVPFRTPNATPTQ